MRFLRFTLVLPLLAAPAAARERVGSFAAWAAFCDEPRRCYAISTPSEQSNAPFLAISIGSHGPVLHARIGRSIRSAGIRIGDANFALVPAGEDATAGTPTTRRIVAAMRSAETLALDSTGVHGGRRRQHYRLAGAPSAIDAAIVAALRR